MAQPDGLKLLRANSQYIALCGTNGKRALRAILLDLSQTFVLAIIPGVKLDRVGRCANSKPVEAHVIYHITRPRAHSFLAMRVLGIDSFILICYM